MYHPGLTQADDDKSQWVYELWDEMRRIQPGMTRGELLAFFEPQGGLSHPKQGSFFCRRCRYFLADAEFDLYDETAPLSHVYDKRDTIRKISAVYVGVPDMG